MHVTKSNSASKRREFWIKLSSSLLEPLLMMGLIIGPWVLLLLCCAWIVILRPNDRAGSTGEAPGAEGRGQSTMEE